MTADWTRGAVIGVIGIIAGVGSSLLSNIIAHARSDGRIMTLLESYGRDIKDLQDSRYDFRARLNDQEVSLAQLKAVHDERHGAC